MNFPSSPERLAARLRKEETRTRHSGPVARWRAMRLNRRLARVDFGALMAALHEPNASELPVKVATCDTQRRNRALGSPHPHTAG